MKLGSTVTRWVDWALKLRIQFRSQLMGLVENKLGVRKLKFVKGNIFSILPQFVANVREYHPPLQALILKIKVQLHFEPLRETNIRDYPR